MYLLNKKKYKVVVLVHAYYSLQCSLGSIESDEVESEVNKLMEYCMDECAKLGYNSFNKLPPNQGDLLSYLNNNDFN